MVATPKITAVTNSMTQCISRVLFLRLSTIHKMKMTPATSRYSRNSIPG